VVRGSARVGRHVLFLLLYVPALLALGVYVYLLESHVVAYVVAVVAAFMLAQFLLGGEKHAFVGLVSTYLLASVVSGVTLLRVRSVPLMPAWVLYALLAFVTGIMWSVSAGAAARTLRLRYSSVKWVLRLACVVSLALSMLLYVSVIPHAGELALEPALIIGLSILLAALFLTYDSLLFHRVLSVIASTEAGRGGDEPLFTQFLTFFAFTLAIVVVLIPNFKPGERPYLGLGIAFSYLYASLALSFAVSVFLNHGLVLDAVHDYLARVEDAGFLRSSTADYYRLRYPSSLINLFNYVETLGAEGRALMSVEVGEAFSEGLKIVAPALRGVRALKVGPRVVEELRKLRIMEVRKDVHDALRSADPSGRVAKSFEARVLRAYLGVMSGDSVGVRRELRQLRGELKAALREAREGGNGDGVAVISRVLEELRGGEDSLTRYVAERPIRLRDLRNHLVHGRLSREYVVREGKVLDGLEILKKPVELYVLTSALLAYVVSRTGGG